MTRTITAAGVTFEATDFRGYYACTDCGGMVAGPEMASFGTEPAAHVCS